MTEPTQSSPPTRRSILGFAIVGLSAIFSAVIGLPIVCYVLDPRHRKGPKNAMKLVEGVKLDELVNDKPAQGVIRDTRTDGWTLYPNDVIGRVWVVQVGPRPANVDAMTPAEKKAYLLVFTTICPHLGCSVNVGGPGFACPCHAATFNIDGKRANESNPAQRGMDTLDWEIDEADPDKNRIKVTFKRFKANDAKKVPLGGGDDEVPNA
jgi:Rieske Fe-S protein